MPSRQAYGCSSGHKEGVGIKYTWCFLCCQAEHGSLPRPGVSADGDKLLQLVHKLAAAKGGDAKVEVDEALVRKFASGEHGTL
jgi:hypothetical protein